MLKLLTSGVLCVSLCADVVSEFYKKAYENSGIFSVKSVKVDKILELKNGMNAKFLSIDLVHKPSKKVITKQELYFENGEIFVTDLVDVSRKISLKDELLGEKMSIKFERKEIENTQNCN